jgi:phosphatidate phosphatase PAH1
MKAVYKLLLAGFSFYASSGPMLSAQNSQALGCNAAPSCEFSQPSAAQSGAFFGEKPRGNPYHMAFDRFLAEGDDQWVIGRFTYGNILKRANLRGEAVDIYVLRNCQSNQWEHLGRAWTSMQKGQNQSVEGFDDRGGQVFFKIPEDKKLGLGRHRLRLVVDGDSSGADMYIEVLEPGTSIFVSDVDGTLTGSELQELWKLVLTGGMSTARPLAADLFTKLEQKGYRPFYLTARPEFLHERTRDFLKAKGFPGGVLRTSSKGLIGLKGAPAVDYKSQAMFDLQDRGFNLVFAFGNTDSDAEAFYNTGLDADRRFLFKYQDEAFGGTTIDSYQGLDYLVTTPEACL